MASSSAACVLGGRTIQLVGEQQMREHGPFLKREVPLAGAVILLENLGAENVARHEIGGELNAPKLERERLAEDPHEQCLAESGHTLEQAVPTREQSDQELLDGLILTDDDARDLAAHARELVEVAADVGLGQGLRRH